MSILGVTVSKRNGGLGRKNPTKDMTAGLVIQGVAPAGTLSYDLGDIVKLQSEDDAALYGFDADYDSTNTVLVYNHISEFFRENPDGVLYLMVVAQTVTLAQMCDSANSYVQKLITDASTNGDIRIVAVALNPTAGYSGTRTLQGGLDKDVFDAVPKAQALADAAFTNHYPVDVILIEGREFNGTAAAATDLRTLASPNVSIVIGADPAVSGSNARYNTYAAVGAALGLLSKRKVNECLGQVDDGNLTDAALGKFSSAGLSSNLATNSYADADLTALDTKGYIFCMNYKNYSGVYFNDSHTCTAASSDYAQIENNRTINKAVRNIYQVLMPKVKKTILLNDDGTIRVEVRKEYESLARKALTQMLADGEISALDVYIDPTQDLLSSDNLDVKFSIVPTAIGRTLTASVGFENPNA